MRRIPKGLLSRAGAAGRMAGHLGLAAARRVVRTSEADDAALGQALFDELDQLKGMAMKVGQILSYMDVGLPDGTIERLSRLQEGADALPMETVREILTQDLGAPVSDLFERFDPVPVAAASIGQVHRALANGREVAVKIRYPGVTDTIDGDLGHLHRIGRLASLASSVDGVALVRELHARMREECDYVREAWWQDRFAQMFRGDPDLTVPEVVPALSADGVLTTHWHEGRRLASLTHAPQAERNAVGATLVRFPYTTLLGHGVLQADPHPGNFLVTEGQRVVALDYGCVRVFDTATVESWRRLTTVVLQGERSSFLDALVATGQVPRPDAYDVEEGWQMHRWMFAPYLTPSFRFDRSWWLAGLKYTRPTAANQRKVDIPPPWIWLMRMQWGLHAVLTRLGAEGDFRALLEQALTLPLTPAEPFRGA